MIRIMFALVLSGLIACLAFQSQSSSLLAQAKKEKTKKNKDAPPPEGEIKEDLSRVLPVFDPGTHTQPISAMGFTKDKSKLITVGQDFSIQVWSTATGERLDILRLPGYGREKGYDAGRWDVAAVSHDGSRVAIGGQLKYLSAGGDDNSARLVVVDVVKRSVVRVQLRTGRNRPVTAIAFSPDGDRLAITIDHGPKENAILMVVGDLANRVKNARPGIQTMDCQQVSVSKTPTVLSFSPDGKRLATGEFNGKSHTIWEVPADAAPLPKLVKDVNVDMSTMGIGWSPDGSQYVHSIKLNSDGEGQIRGFDVRNADGDLVKSYRKADLVPALDANRFVTIFDIRFLDANTVYFVANGGSGPEEGGGTIAGIVDLKSGTSRRVAAHAEGMVNVPVGAVAADGKLVAYTVSGNTEAMVGAPDGKAFVPCGQQTPIPYYLGWSKDPAKPGFAWTDSRELSRIKERDPKALQFGFDLSKVEPIGEIQNDNYVMGRSKLNEWSIRFIPQKKMNVDDGFKGAARVMKGETTVVGLPIGRNGSYSFIPQGDKPPLIAMHFHVNYEPERAQILQSDGTLLTRLLPGATLYSDMVASPDGRFLICTTGTPRLVIYRTDGSPYPFLSFAQLNGEWVCWTPEGYFDASPGGEKMFGWAINNGPNELVSFHSAEKFAKQFRRPDLIKLAIEKGSMKEALAILKTAPTEVESILPPTATLSLVKQDGAKLQVKAVATSGNKAKPIKSIQLLLNGRPLAEGKGLLIVAEGKPAEATWDVVIPGGRHELKLLVNTYDAASISEPLLVTGPKIPGQQPTLFRVCIGINDYDEADLKLNAATKDASQVFNAFELNCTGPTNRFGAAKGELLLDKQATREAVMKSLNGVRKTAKPGDLVVVFFAGHGHKQDSDFYLLTKEADTSKSLKGVSLSGADLRSALGEMECPVLLIMDACHSAKGAKAFRPATDDLTRSLTEDSVGVTVMAAAMAHEVARATSENGFFTAGLLKALKAETGVPFDPYERALYTHHLYSVVFAEVRKASNGKQNPFLNSPWTVPPLVVREIVK